MNGQRREMGLIGGTEKRHIQVVDYDPQWPEVFRRHANIIRAALGDVALRIEHVGSTAVPGLAAKPIVDILLVVGDSGCESSYLNKMEAAGYELRVREPDFTQHRMFRTPGRDVHVHVFSCGSPEVQRVLAFRDRLRVNQDDRHLYEQTKRRLAAQSWPDMNAYAQAKTEVIERIIAAAQEAGQETA